MARDGSGSYSLPEAAFVYDTVISETAVNNNFSDISNALTQSLSKDGQTTPTANLPMGGYKHTGVANATGRTDYAAAGQVQDESLTWCGTAGGTKNALTLTPTPAITAYTGGQRFRFKAGATQSDDAVTIAVSGQTAKAAQINDAALSATVFIEANKHYEALYDGAAFQLTRISANSFADPMTTRGDMIYRGASGAVRLPAGTVGQVLTTGGAGADPSWTTLTTGTVTATAGEAIADRDLCYFDEFNQRGGGAGKIYKVDADAVGPVRIGRRLCIALAAISSGATGSVQVSDGAVTGFTSLTSGAPVYASATAGALTQTVPVIPASGTQIASRLVGFATSATAIWFAPDSLTTFAKYNSALASGSSVTVEHFADSGAAERVARAYLAQVTATGTTGTFAQATNTSNGIGPSAGAQYGGMSFTAPASATLSSVKISVTSVATSGAWKVGLYTNNAGSPGTLVGSYSTPQTISASGDKTFTWSSGAPAMTSGTVYWIVVLPDTGTPDISLNRCADQAGYTSGRANAITSITGGAMDDWRIEINYTSGAARDEPVTIGSETINPAVSDRVTCRFDDGAGASTDTKTTFYNRTGSSRDLVAEVTL